MKPALLEVMRMNRICRMVLATCLGSFILVIFYFQSMLHPGRGRVSVVLLNIFFSLALLSASSNLTSSLRPLRGSLLPRSAGHGVGMGREGALPLPPSSRLEVETARRDGGVCCLLLSFRFFSFFLFFFVSCLLARWQRKVGLIGSYPGRGLMGRLQNSVRVAAEG